jgi:uncharacterized iron-regulated membrane protein
MGTEKGFQGNFRQSMSWLHTWAGLVLGIVLYFIFITGSFGYFNAEIDRWMRPEIPSASKALPAPQLSARVVSQLQEKYSDSRLWLINLPLGRYDQEVSAYIEPRTRPGVAAEEIEGVEVKFDPLTAAPLTAARETGGGNALYAMHYQLHYFSYNTAIYIVGIATMFMLIALVTGVVVHKKIFGDFFTFRPTKGQRSWLDAHNLSSVLTLPFILVITYSGLIFYTFEYMPSIKWAAYGTDSEAGKTFDQEVSAIDADTDPLPTGKAAALTPIAPLIAQAEARWGKDQVAYLAIYNPGDVNSRVRIDRNDKRTVNRFSDTLLFDGRSGALLSTGSRKDNTGDQTFSNVMLALHEGHFASPVLRWLYFISGLFGAAMVANGLIVWTAKRRQKLKKGREADSGLLFVERFNVGTIAGLLIAVAAYFWANRLLPVELDNRADWELHVLFIVWAMTFMHASLRPARQAWVEQFGTAAVLYSCLPLLNALTTEVHLGYSMPQRDWVLAGFDLAALTAGLLLALVSWVMHTRSYKNTVEAIT